MTERRLTWIGLALFLLSIALSVALLRYPYYGGDELWFATPLLHKGPAELRLFEFVYAGPLKALLTWPLFELAGFNVVCVRLFTLATYVLMVGAWCLYLRRRALPVAAAASLGFFGLNADLQFFARVDINQATLHELVILLHFLAFLAIVERGPSARNTIAFVVLSFVDVNNHLRNVWIGNALLLAFAVDHVASNGISRSAAASALRRGWPIALGWLIGTLEFAYVLHHFRDSPALADARALGHGYTWAMRAEEAARAVPQLLSGSRVLEAGYEVHASPARAAGVLAGALTLATVLWLRRAAPNALGSRLLRISAVVWLAVVIQYAVTKSARWPWHGNSVILFFGTTFGLAAQSLWTHARPRAAAAYAALTLTTFGASRYALERAIEPSVAYKSGFALGVWNPQCLDAVRAFLHDRPASYLVADWSIGRPLALELRYRPRPGTTITLYDSGIPDAVIAEARPDQLVLRAVGAAVTVPDLSDARIERLGRRFRARWLFRDAAGRAAYEIGHVVAP